MRPLRFLVPGTGGRLRSGGLLVELQTLRLLQAIVPAELVTYRRREPGVAFLPDLLAAESAPGEALWIVSWGFNVPQQLRRLRGRPVAYHAHSSGYGFALPPGVPVLAVSRNTLGYWGDAAPRNPLFLVPNALGTEWIERGLRPGGPAVLRAGAPAGRRPVDVLVQQRKSSAYVLQQLVPALRQRGLRVEVQSGWVDDLVDLFNSATVVLYDSADYWRGRRVSEGFGLPPLEALACGCVVFASLNHALADTLDPGRVGHQIGAGSLAADLERIEAAVADPQAWQVDPRRLEALLEASREEVLLQRWQQALEAINRHWDRLEAGEAPLRPPPRWRITWQQRADRLRRLLSQGVGSIG
ncbi:MAG: glycosyltransferase [Synechococcus sp.]